MLKIFRKMDTVLIEGCRRGEPAAQQELFSCFSEKMFAVCRRYISNKADAEEVLISGFVLVFTKIAQFRNEGSFEGWMRKIMVNEALSFLRKKRSLFLYSELDGASEESEPALADSAILTEELLGVIASLPDGYRTVFNLYAIEGYSHKEIAELLGIDESTSKSQLSRARQLLRRRLISFEKQSIKNIQDGKPD